MKDKVPGNAFSGYWKRKVQMNTEAKGIKDGRGER